MPGAALKNRLAHGKQLLAAARAGGMPEDIVAFQLPTEKAKNGTSLSRSLWLRMLFSCLVDADFLDTELFMDAKRAAMRGGYPVLSALAPAFERYMQGKSIAALNTPVNQIRAEVLAACLNRAADVPGLFTLSVPTGGGKTLSSLAFAMGHAVKYEKRRVIYVIPFTSIVEQTAEQFRSIFGDCVLEHHSNLDVEDPARENACSRLACENWDAPIVVTTSVQFFESFFASRTSRCRKLHNVVNSVVIFDEAQLLPPDFLAPILELIRDLALNYGVTFVFSTATQPALAPHQGPDFSFTGLPGLREIMPDPLSLHERLKRTTISLVNNLAKPLSWDDLAVRLKGHDVVLCIVNRRDDARMLWEKMPAGTIHLSALMCGAHRSACIARIKADLCAGKSVRVISTQLVEAGVDLDFPVVYRALAGLDSVAQAAGRCNREGLLAMGNVFVFQPESNVPVGYLRQAAEIGRQLMVEDVDDLMAPERFEKFFRRLYWLRGDRLDREGIMTLLGNDNELRVSFRSAATRFRLIDDTLSQAVIVRFGESDNLIEMLRFQGPTQRLLRSLQRYVVNLPRRVHSALVAQGVVEEVHPGIFVQGHGNLYDQQLGFCVDRSLIYAPDELIV
jgi:CRISPR-associated endonuclease/helicase Cas3